jgi:hypothetical protein
MKVRNISLADVAHETARCPTRMLPHHAGARLDEFALEFEGGKARTTSFTSAFLITEKSASAPSAFIKSRLFIIM